MAQRLVRKFEEQVEATALGIGIADGQLLAAQADRWNANLIQTIWRDFKAAEYDVLSIGFNNLIIDDGVFLQYHRHDRFAADFISGLVAISLYPHLDIDERSDWIRSFHCDAFFSGWVEMYSR